MMIREEICPFFGISYDGEPNYCQYDCKFRTGDRFREGCAIAGGMAVLPDIMRNTERIIELLEKLSESKL